MDKRELMVTIRCLAYNHEPYIRQCLDGFVMQKTNFRFEAIVHDDASTDGTAAIIREYAEKYPDIIKPIFETENQYSKRDGSLKRIMDEHTHGKYVAMCEGDDYWIDPLKLQKQVDFLEANSEYVLVHSDFIALNNSTGQTIRNASSKYTICNGEVFEKLFEGCFIRTPTICYRKIDLDLRVNDLPKNTFSGDLFLFYNLASKGKFHFMKEEMCVYRVLQESATHTSSEKVRRLMWLRYKNLDYYIAHYYKINNEILKKLDSKWFKIDLRNCIASKDYEGLKGIIFPEGNISIVYKILYYLCRSKILLSFLYIILKCKKQYIKNKWF